MKKHYILHGCCDRDEYMSDDYPSPSNFHWIPWLQKQLVMAGHECQTPEMTAPYKPSYQTWKHIFEQFKVDENTVLIAHSCGCGFLLKWLSENNHKIDKLILVAPWRDPFKKLGSFLQGSYDVNLLKRINSVHIFYSLNEFVEGVKETVDEVRKLFPNSQYHEFTTHGHFCLGDMGTEKFPELLKIVK